MPNRVNRGIRVSMAHRNCVGPTVVDVFSGMGGLSLGFKQAGFAVQGYDHNEHAVSTYRLNVGECKKLDLGAETPRISTDVLVGGPPCRPWSRLNVQRARREHPDRPLVGAFTAMVMRYTPPVFVLENVPLLEKDPVFEELTARARRLGYDVEATTIQYSDYGAALTRRRLFAFGSRRFSVRPFMEALEKHKRPAGKVGHVLARYRGVGHGAIADHEWPALRTIDRYSDKYQSGKFGWYVLDPDRPAPSFGHVQKTYTLHPDSGNGLGPRVISVREAMAILGFGMRFRFPKGVPMTAKYRMVADAVSPVFSRTLAHTLLGFL